VTATCEVLAAAVANRPSVSLPDMNAAAELMERIDRKYLVTADQLAALLDGLSDELAVLEISGRRLHEYRSTYFDTWDLMTYRAHVQGRRRRFKLRLREYVESDIEFLELKYKGWREQTFKSRSPHDHQGSQTCLGQDLLCRQGWSFLRDEVERVYDLDLPRALWRIATTRHARSTFLAADEGSRVTVDVALHVEDASRVARMRDDYAIIETKSMRAATPVDRELKALGVRPASVSKYCLAVALLRDDVPANPWHRTVRRHFTNAVPGQPLPLAPRHVPGLTQEEMHHEIA
jgi:VTC domain